MKTATHCQRCEDLCHDAVAGPGTVHLRLPLNHSLGKMLSLLRHSTWSYTEQGGMISIHTDDRALSPLVSALIGVLSSVEQADTRVIFEPDGKTMELADYFEACSLLDCCVLVDTIWPGGSTCLNTSTPRS